MFVYHLVDEVAEAFLDLIDDLDDEIDELEDMVGDASLRAIVGRRLRELRHDVRGIRRTLSPTRDAVRKVVDDRVELDEASSCSHTTSRSPSATPTTSCCARRRRSSRRATRSAASATTSRARSRTTRTR